MPEIQVEPAPDASPAESGALPIIVCWAAPASGTSSSPAEQAPPWVNKVLKVSAPGPADVEPAIRRMSELRAKWDFGTSNAGPPETQDAPDAREADMDVGAAEQTPSEPAANLSLKATHRAIAELRRVSGLTSEQVGRLFGVSRRSIHAWVSGNPLNARNEERLMRSLDVMRYADRGFAKYNRAALFDTSEGPAPYDLLAEQKFEEARARLGKGPGRRRLPPMELSPEAKAARKPLRPEILMNAKWDRIHEESGRVRFLRMVKVEQDEDS